MLLLMKLVEIVWNRIPLVKRYECLIAQTSSLI